MSLLSALNLHGMIEQIPRGVHVVTTVQRPHLETTVVVRWTPALTRLAAKRLHRTLRRKIGRYEAAV